MDNEVSMDVPASWLGRDAIALSEVSLCTGTKVNTYSVMVVRKVFSTLPKAHPHDPTSVPFDLALDLLRADVIARASGVTASTALRIVRGGFATFELTFPEQEAAAAA